MKFTLRDVFWLLLVIAVLCAWYVQQEKRAAALQAYYEQQFRKVAEVMKAQDIWRRELIQVKSDYQNLRAKVASQTRPSDSETPPESN